MKKNDIIRRFAVCLCFFMFIGIHISAAENMTTEKNISSPHTTYEAYHALIIGVGRYTHWKPLTHPTQDASDMADFLEQLGFKVTLLQDPSSREMKKSIQALVNGAGQQPNVGIVLYYSGHGATRALEDGTQLGWIIPADCPAVENSAKFVRYAVSMKDIEQDCMKMASKHVIMLFDASFSGDAFSITQPAVGGNKKQALQPTRQYIISGKTDEPVSSPSMFKKFTIKGLQGYADFINDGQITGSELASFLTTIVPQSTKKRQHPQYGKIKHTGMFNGDFTFPPYKPRTGNATLYVETLPPNAKIKILNIKPRFSQGMKLKPGKYLIEISFDGYMTEKQWVKLFPGKKKVLACRLNKNAEKIVNSLGMTFDYFPPGKCRAEHQGKTLNIPIGKGFYMQRNAVMVKDFRRFVKETNYTPSGQKNKACWIKNEIGIYSAVNSKKKSKPHWSTASDDHAAICISWYDAQAFIEWLNKKERHRYALPTDAQWEYACAKKKALFAGKAVWEWCDDWYAGSALFETRNLKGVEKIVRRYAEKSPADNVSGPRRTRLRPDIVSDTLGFRLVWQP